MSCNPHAAALLATCRHGLALAVAALGDMLAGLPTVLTDRDLTATVIQLTRVLQDQAAVMADAVKCDRLANLWMPGIIGDARRDAQSQDDPWSRDVALIGAVRKGVAALIVSLQTAHAVATESNDNIAGQLGEHRDQLARADDMLACHLVRLARR